MTVSVVTDVPLLSDELPGTFDSESIHARKTLLRQMRELPDEAITQLQYLQPQVGCFNPCETPDAAWHTANVSLQCTALDLGSGIAANGSTFWTPVNTPWNFVLTTNVPAGTKTDNASTNSRVVCDLVGNCSTAGPLTGIKVDRTAQ